jgi:hypothetical protein
VAASTRNSSGGSTNPWFLPQPAPRLDTSDPEVQTTARHEAGHAAAAFLLGWEVTEARLKAEGSGYCGFRSPRDLDRSLRSWQYAVICLAARAHTGWMAFPGDHGDRRNAYKALRDLDNDPRGLSSLRDAAKREAEQLAGSGRFRAIARRVAEALLERGGELNQRELEPLLREASREHARAAW